MVNVLKEHNNNNNNHNNNNNNNNKPNNYYMQDLTILDESDMKNLCRCKRTDDKFQRT